MKLLAIALLLTATLYAQEIKPLPEADSKVDTVPPGLPRIKPIEHKDITYRTAPDKDGKPVAQILDVYENPDGKPHPVIVYWHGGAWWKGNRPQSVGNRALLDMGFNVVNVDYRLTDVAPAPAAVEDVLCSLAWVNKNVAQYHFDTRRVVAYGTSAGGHLALMAGFLPQSTNITPKECGPLPKVAAVMDFYGIPDVYGVVANGIPLSKSTVRWVGGTGAQDPASLQMATKMSPNTYLRAGLPPVFIAHGDADPTVPYQQSLDLKKSLEGLHVPVTMFSVPKGGHGEFPPDQTLLINEALIKFFVENHIIAPLPK
jgi:acetyl esterase/lipase